MRRLEDYPDAMDGQLTFLVHTPGGDELFTEQEVRGFAEDGEEWAIEALEALEP